MTKKHTNETFDLVNTSIYKRVGNYLGAKIGIEFLCPLCTRTWVVQPTNILSGYGCPKCKGCNKFSNPYNPKYTNEEFDLKLIEKGIKYKRIGNYTLTKNKIDFQCPDCKYIWGAKPTNIISGRGCPSCAKYGFKPDLEAYLYIIKIDNFIKVGITNNEPAKRYKQITNKEVIELKVIKGTGKNIRELEQKIHNKFEHYCPEKSLNSGNTECFSIDNLTDILIIIGKV